MTSQPDYVSALRADRRTVTIAKFDWTSVPLAIYNVSLKRNGTLKCDCPGSWRGAPCKHLAMAAPLFLTHKEQANGL